MNIILKKIVFIILFVFSFGFSSYSQENTYKAYTDGWLTNLDEAYNISKKTSKPIMANFTGSDWCGWCIKLKREVFDKPEFKKWAKENVILLELDFPRRKKIPQNIKEQNTLLAQQFQVRGYPTIWIFNLNKKGTQYQIEQLGKTGYLRGGPSVFTSEVSKMINVKN